MQLRTVINKIYPLVFVVAFLGSSLIPSLNANVSITTFDTAFSGHDQLFQYFNTLRYGLGDRVFANAIAGKAGWLFYTGNSSMNDYQRTGLFTLAELKAASKSLDALNRQLAQKGIMLLVVIAPDKSTIYPQFMPDELARIGKRSRLDQFFSYMQKHGNTPLIDLRPDLLAAAKSRVVYYRTDTHWNPYGSYVAYARIMAALSQRYPALAPHPLSDYVPITGTEGTDMPQMLGIPSQQDPYFSLRPRFDVGTHVWKLRWGWASWGRNLNLPSALIFYDSFLDPALPLLEPHFRQTTSILPSSIPGVWSMNWVAQVHPDIVIIEAAERYIGTSDYFLGLVEHAPQELERTMGP